VVMVTHDLDTIVSISDRVAVLADQKIAALGTVAEVAAVPHPFIENFFQGERGKRALEGLKSPAAVSASGQQER
jgi:phospholipid/cholesterol/gamma-HCH transport system ATP-binding protein